MHSNPANDMAIDPSRFIDLVDPNYYPHRHIFFERGNALYEVIYMPMNLSLILFVDHTHHIVRNLGSMTITGILTTDLNKIWLCPGSTENGARE